MADIYVLKEEFRENALGLDQLYTYRENIPRKGRMPSKIGFLLGIYYEKVLYKLML